MLLINGAMAAYLPNAQEIYQKLKLESLGLDQDVFEYALKGFDRINKKKEIITIIDFTQSSREKRLFTIDLKKEELLYNERVTHGINSGEEYADDFSNIEGSKKTSIGFYLTAETYNGKYGYSLKLDGLDKRYNSNARERYIVVHGAKFANPNVVDEIGMLGWSWGCPAVRTAISERLINAIKGGSVLFHYYSDRDYLQASKYLKE